MVACIETVTRITDAMSVTVLVIQFESIIIIAHIRCFSVPNQRYAKHKLARMMSMVPTIKNPIA